jgi:hypothetical protein
MYAGGITIPGFKLNNRPIVREAARQWHNDRHKD